jgi:hypothetical protein
VYGESGWRIPAGLFAAILRRDRRPRTPGQALHETGLRRRADRVKPAADVNLGMSLSAIMAGPRGVGRFRVPPIDGKIGISTSNHEPVDRIRGNESTDFTSKFLQRCHARRSRISVLCHLHSAIEAGRRFGVRIVSSPTCSLFTVPPKWEA